MRETRDRSAGAYEDRSRPRSSDELYQFHEITVGSWRIVRSGNSLRITQTFPLVGDMFKVWTGPVSMAENCKFVLSQITFIQTLELRALLDAVDSVCRSRTEYQPLPTWLAALIVAGMAVCLGWILWNNLG